MEQRETSVVRRRRLRVELRRIREESGRTQKAVAEALGWSTHKVIRIETGAVNVSTSDLMALLHFYGITDSTVTEELLAVTRTRVAGWWDEYRSYFSQQFLNFLGYEDSAICIRQYMGDLVPGLLQTEEYARAVVSDYQPDGEQTDRETMVRMRRQQLFDRPHGPEFQYVLDEVVVHRWMGGREAMLRQLARLKELAQHPRVSIRIVPFSEGMYPGMQVSSFTIVELPSEDGVVTLVEDPHRDVIVDDPETSSNYISKFSKLQQIACPEGEVDKIIDPVIERMRLGTTV
ncbi:MAG TPA: helix-turn-helix transcriptional regulator [Actinophytocola sp.]|uniref:helix-turn-helix domain-containing protein n=1 Tax=Actinophytocola sp. TaxID=1872138 RepID=UPI002DDDBCA1|nr:helix-turn-helix transcriptional regulator [Actinophytocola sp.]HEV2781025.1 helix-turn-helix transcriptional regulator [Actinophytocola sp.]